MSNESSIESFKEEEILSKYITKNAIGKGTFSTVKLGINKKTGEKVAIKILEKSKIQIKDDLERIEREIKMLKDFNHINVIKIYEILENESYFYIIMEYCENGELFNHIVDLQKLSDKEASYFYYQLINGLKYIHSKNVVHRDLKPENLLLGKGNILKIIDFGLSNYFNGKNLLSTPCGSPCYASPEMVSGNKYNGFKIDIWSTGIILYAMVCGYLPFEDNDNDILFTKILECNLEFPDNLSNNCIDLMNKILVTKPDKRININDIKKHPFYLQGKDIFEKIHPDLVNIVENGFSNDENIDDDADLNNRRNDKINFVNNQVINNVNNNTHHNNKNEEKNVDFKSDDKENKNNINCDIINENINEKNNEKEKKIENKENKKDDSKINNNNIIKIRNEKKNKPIKIKEKNRNKERPISIKTEGDISNNNNSNTINNTNQNKRKKEKKIENLKDFIMELSTKNNIYNKKKKPYRNNTLDHLKNQKTNLNTESNIKEIRNKSNRRINTENLYIEKNNKTKFSGDNIRNNNNIIKKNSKFNSTRGKSAKPINSKNKIKTRTYRTNYELFNIDLNNDKKKTTNNTSNSLLNGSNENSNNIKLENVENKYLDNKIKSSNLSNNNISKKHNYFNEFSSGVNYEIKSIFRSNFNNHKNHASITNRKINDLMNNPKYKLIVNMSSSSKNGENFFPNDNDNNSNVINKKKNSSQTKSVKSIQDKKRKLKDKNFINLIDAFSNRNLEVKNSNRNIKLYSNSKNKNKNKHVYLKTEFQRNLNNQNKKSYKEILLSSGNVQQKTNRLNFLNNKKKKI